MRLRTHSVTTVHLFLQRDGYRYIYLSVIGSAQDQLDRGKLFVFFYKSRSRVEV